MRYTAREEIPRKFPREPHVFPIIVTFLNSTDSKHGVTYVFNHLVSVTKLRVIGHLVSVTKLHVFNHLASVAKPQVFYYLLSDAKIFDIIFKLSTLL